MQLNILRPLTINEMMWARQLASRRFGFVAGRDLGVSSADAQDNDKGDCGEKD